MPLLSFDTRRRLEAITKRDGVATVATVATVFTGTKREQHYIDSTSEKSSLSCNNLVKNDIPPGEFAGGTPATAATAATAAKKSSDVNALGGPKTVATGCYSSNILRRLESGKPVDDADIIAALRDRHPEFMERAAIAEIDGNQNQAVAEQIALDELVIEFWHRTPERLRARAILWGDVRRMAFKATLLELAE
jgi:hypothetical protein